MRLALVKHMNKEHGKSHHFETCSIYETESLQKAAALVAEGKPVGLYNRGVCAIIGNGADPSFSEAVKEVKGEKRGNRPLAAMLPTRKFVELLDPEKISDKLHEVFLDADELAKRTSSLCFIRGPVTEEAALLLPASMVFRLDDGTPVVQNWDPEGNNPAHLLVGSIMDKGVAYPAVTSLNASGTPEIVDQIEGEKFSREHGISLFLSDPKDKKRTKGSYSIIGISNSGVHLVRDGNVPVSWLRKILGIDIEDGDATPSKFDPPEIPNNFFDSSKPLYDTRVAVIRYLHEE